jgi:hypothetical protein
MQSTLLAEEEGFDPNRDANSVPKESSVRQAVNPLAFLVGPVEVKYDGDPAKNRVADLSKYIDEDKKVIKSITGELDWDYGIGVCRLNAPKVQGVSGFLAKAGPTRLGAVSIESKNDYATILAVSLDDKELTGSTQVLVQTTTVCRPYGWKESPATFQDAEKKNTYQGKRIDDLGALPWNVRDTQVTLAIKNPKLRKATQLDANGYPHQELKVQTADGELKVTLPANALYVVLE